MRISIYIILHISVIQYQIDIIHYTLQYSVPNRTALVWIVRDDWEQLRRALAKTMDTGNEDGRETHNKACCESPPPQ